MKRIIVVLVLIAIVLTPAFAQKAKGSPAQDQTAELNDVIERINAALAEVQNNSEIPSLQTATVKLETAYDKTGGGGFKIFVKASRKWAKGTANAITYKYEKPNAIATLQVKNSELVKFITNAALAYKNSTSVLGLEKNSFEIEVSFSITKTTSGGIEFEVFGIGFDGAADFERKVAHTITMEFK